MLEVRTEFLAVVELVLDLKLTGGGDCIRRLQIRLDDRDVIAFLTLASTLVEVLELALECLDLILQRLHARRDRGRARRRHLPPRAVALQVDLLDDLAQWAFLLALTFHPGRALGLAQVTQPLVPVFGRDGIDCLLGSPVVSLRDVEGDDDVQGGVRSTPLGFARGRRDGSAPGDSEGKELQPEALQPVLDRAGAIELDLGLGRRVVQALGNLLPLRVVIPVEGEAASFEDIPC